MKTADDYDDLIYKSVHLDSDEDKEKVYRLINQVIKEAWNEALDNAAESAITKSFKLSKYSKYPRWKVVKNEEVDLFSYDFKTEVDKQSIIKLKL